MYVKTLMANCENMSISLWIWRGGNWRCLVDVVCMLPLMHEMMNMGGSASHPC